MGDYSFNITPILWLCFFVGFVIWGCWELVDWIWIDEVIKTTTPITPELEIIVKDNIIDTLYIYRQP